MFKWNGADPSPPNIYLNLTQTDCVHPRHSAQVTMGCPTVGTTKSTGSPKQGALLLSRAMEGAKAFLHPSLLEVPWLWRLDPVRMKAKPLLDSDVLRNYQKLVRNQIEVHYLFFLL